MYGICIYPSFARKVLYSLPPALQAFVSRCRLDVFHRYYHRWRWATVESSSTIWISKHTSDHDDASLRYMGPRTERPDLFGSIELGSYIRSSYTQLLVVIISIIQGVIIPDIILLQRSLKSLVCQFKCSYFGFSQRGKANIHDLHCSHALTVPYSSSLCPCLCWQLCFRGLHLNHGIWKR